MCQGKMRRISRKNLMLGILVIVAMIASVIVYNHLTGTTASILRTQDVSYGKFTLDMEDMEMEDLTSASSKKQKFRVKTTVTMETEVYSTNDTLPEIRMYDDAHKDLSLGVS